MRQLVKKVLGVDRMVLYFTITQEIKTERCFNEVFALCFFQFIVDPFVVFS
jgi:hypothetical protein